ncbi:nucleotidyltransferase family protein [Thioalkalivibrio sp. HL-Eb18]|uniref:nucleotidyltransferase domain-containing protein n=1 Tax=Thioalkalivibrio sp. HL-Eb18 TaxID=1266913 RepID=UPI0003667C6F|nr:nucleotidyltransferase family protein [Thioalkalivibrio sp. HL-Eb18]
MDADTALRLALARPESMAERTAAEWAPLLAAARESALPGTLWHLADDAGLADGLPEPVASQLWGAALIAEHRSQALVWELHRLENGLLSRMSPGVALKGAAYLAAGLPNARGRLANDIDLLFPRNEVERAEKLLFFEGWSGTHHNIYDQRYYREWMHELPPLVHQNRGTTLDLHHNILPETFRGHPDPARLRQQSQALPEPFRFRILCPAHLVLHAIVHLFSETEWDRGLRDLYDIHVLLGHFGARDGDAFWEHFVAEAESLNIAWMAERALWTANRLLLTEVPPEPVKRLARARAGIALRGPGRWAFVHGLHTRAGSITPRRDALARGMLFLRGHWLKMPAGLLARHLFHKAFLAEKPETATAQPQPEQHG